VIDLVWCYEIVFHVVDVCIDEFFSFTHCTSTRGNHYKLYKPHFSHYQRPVWNALPADVIDFGSVKKCRCSL